MNSVLAVLGLSGGELMLVMAVILVLFGSKKIPDFAKGLGQGIKEFKKASREVQDEIERAGHVEYTPPPPSPVPAPTPALQPPADTQPQLAATTASHPAQTAEPVSHSAASATSPAPKA